MTVACVKLKVILPNIAIRGGSGMPAISRQIDSLKTSFSSRITRTIKIEDAKIQKPGIDTLLRNTKVVKLVSYLRFEFNIDFIHHKVSLCMLKNIFFNVRSQQLFAGGREMKISSKVLRDFWKNCW